MPENRARDTEEDERHRPPAQMKLTVWRRRQIITTAAPTASWSKYTQWRRALSPWDLLKKF